MYLSVAIVYAIILVLVSPVIWVAWWLLADLWETATGSYNKLHSVTSARIALPGRLGARSSAGAV
jgi:hypothetical protein